MGKHRQQTGEEEEEKKEVWDPRFDRESEAYPLSEQLRPQRAIPTYQAEYWEGWDDNDSLNGNNCWENYSLEEPQVYCRMKG